jgi:hypothetical protein
VECSWLFCSLAQPLAGPIGIVAAKSAGGHASATKTCAARGKRAMRGAESCGQPHGSRVLCLSAQLLLAVMPVRTHLVSRAAWARFFPSAASRNLAGAAPTGGVDCADKTVAGDGVRSSPLTNLPRVAMVTLVCGVRRASVIREARESATFVRRKTATRTVSGRVHLRRAPARWRL